MPEIGTRKESLRDIEAKESYSHATNRLGIKHSVYFIQGKTAAVQRSSRDASLIIVLSGEKRRGEPTEIPDLLIPILDIFWNAVRENMVHESSVTRNP